MHSGILSIRAIIFFKKVYCSLLIQRKKSSDLQAVLVHVCEAATVQVEHSNAAAHSQEVTAAVQSRQVDQDGPEPTLHLQVERDAGAFIIVSIIIIININSIFNINFIINIVINI